jgi:hypothetical protein
MASAWRDLEAARCVDIPLHDWDARYARFTLRQAARKVGRG